MNMVILFCLKKMIVKRKLNFLRLQIFESLNDFAFNNNLLNREIRYYIFSVVSLIADYIINFS